MSKHVFSRSPGHRLPLVVRGTGAELFDEDGRSYLDGSGGAVVNSIGHGVTEVVDAIAAQAAAVAYVHGTAFGSEALDAYADELAPLLPVDDPRIYPVSGGSEAVETAIKLARAYHLGRGQNRSVIIARQGSYHGNTRGALDVSGRAGLRAPYLPWLGHAFHTTPPYEYRCPFPDVHPGGCAVRHAEHLDRVITQIGPDQVAAFIAEPVSGAALGACVPPAEYWPAIAEVCRAHGVLLIADEVMTGFGRTGRWFACEHWGLRPDILVAAKGAASGYWPLGLTVCSGEIHDTVAESGFTHGFTYSHHPVGAAAGRAVLGVLRDLVPTVADRGRDLGLALHRELSTHWAVGDIRGIGLLRAVELVRDRDTRQPFPRHDRIAEQIIAAAKTEGLLLYHATGNTNGHDGDLLLFGPPLVVTPEQVRDMAHRCATAIHDVLGP
ncbi:aspartate aminotransferase family protein [Actinokineospora globicatena]|uniref:aminotransferase family protein n=1 Tax=Actinokineospora globicatena TaxID=103729 RepID=UPI0020A514A4|nr:aminotransferase class III-fold pyridoxal phosphate-dependent enzyme [Actinokineospora globicatena]MCP2304592.1 Adenosylmethionine-8-amino-7-oxononanoate aminotransferase [Actinokineospora globicatena]GLW78037.1 adenosylmethionine-8-amino-7-oxononanoate aminotransferase [Actinokineospora globicatena]GLW85297.1 adenosylmethionine-8-amino-7-oxononanoate aminotransferase [Actinokineospora globicatena]